MSTEYDFERFFDLIEEIKKMIVAGGSVRTLYYDLHTKDFFVYGHFGNSSVPECEPVFSISCSEIEEAIEEANGDLYDAAEILATEERLELFQEIHRRFDPKEVKE